MIEDNINNLKVDLNRIEEKIQSLKKNEKKSIHRRNFANFLTKNLLYHKIQSVSVSSIGSGVPINKSTRKDNNENFDKGSSYVELIEMGRNRPNTNDENIISDLINMDAEYNPNELPDLSIGKLFKKTDDFSVLRGKYDNFHTIDWLKDRAKDRYRHKWLHEETIKGNLLERFQELHDAYSGWFCVFLVAICAGISAGFVDVGVQWMSNLRGGVCKDAFWLNKEQCCWSSQNSTTDSYRNVICDEWYSWNVLFGVVDHEKGYFISFLAHVVISLIFALISATLVKFYAPYACGSGVPEIKTILSGYVMKGYLGSWTLLIKLIGIIFSASAGLTLGKEGPMVHISCAFGNILTRLFPKYGRNEAKKREILSAAAATGVAVAFGAPIGGVLFSLEELSYYFPMKTLWRSFFCAMTGAFILKTVNPYGEGDVLFYLDYVPEWYFFELVPFIILGVLGGIFGFYFIKVNVYICKLRKYTFLKKYPVIEVLIVTFITASIGYFNDYTRISMSELIKRLVSQCRPEYETLMCDYIKNVTNARDIITKYDFGEGIYESIWKLFLAMAFYLAMIVITFGLKVPCGLFIPSLVIGAITGRLMGMGIELFTYNYPNFLLHFSECDQCIVPGVYALVGACAFLGGATRMTVSMVVIMVELTSGLSLMVPLMVSAFVAKIAGEFLNHGGIYDEHIHMNKFPLLENNDDYKYSACALDAMKPKKGDSQLVTFTKDGMTIKDIDTIIDKTDFNGYPIVITKSSQILYGYIWTRDIKKAFEHYKILDLIDDYTTIEFTYSELKNRQKNSINLFKLVDTHPMTVSYQTPMEDVIGLFCKMGVSVLSVCHYGRVLGVITRKDILRHLEEKEKKNK